jgi:hypothetical protein
VRREDDRPVAPDRVQVRLAELVATLSLGIDLGFGQPIEHVLRQCLIALRLAERAGLDEGGRAAVYYTSLLVNVGCHTDAYEQAKWFGDDIALKAGKYDGDLRGLRSALSGIRRLGAGRPPLHRFRLGLEFAISGHGSSTTWSCTTPRSAGRSASSWSSPPACSPRSPRRTGAGTGAGGRTSSRRVTKLTV